MFTDQYLQSCRIVTVHGSVIEKHVCLFFSPFDKKISALLFIAALNQTQYRLPTTAQRFVNGKT